jgi:hypothetical protein
MKKNLHFQSILFCLLISSLPLFALNTSKTQESTYTNPPLQQDQGIQQKRAVLAIERAITSMLSSPDPAKISEGEHLKSLAYDLHPTIYINAGQQINPSGKTPVCVETDINSISLLYEDNDEFRQVELLIIKISKPGDLSTLLDPDNFTSFTNLKYLCISSSFAICTTQGCEAPLISQMVSASDNSGFLILYEISIPE